MLQKNSPKMNKNLLIAFIVVIVHQTCSDAATKNKMFKLLQDKAPGSSELASATKHTLITDKPTEKLECATRCTADTGGCTGWYISAGSCYLFPSIDQNTLVNTQGVRVFTGEDLKSF